MKKIFALILAICMLFALAACSSQSGEEATGDQSTNAPTESQPDEQTLRSQLDNINRGKYGATEEPDSRVIQRVIEIADKRNASMIEVSLAWLLTKTTSPVVGATKKSQIDGFVKALDFRLTEEEIGYLEELYIPHKLVGVIAMNPVEVQAK